MKTFFEEMKDIIEHAEWPGEFHFMCLDLAARADDEIDKTKMAAFVPGLPDEPAKQNAHQITYTAVFAAVMQGYTGRLGPFFDKQGIPEELLKYAQRAALFAVESVPK